MYRPPVVDRKKELIKYKVCKLGTFLFQELTDCFARGSKVILYQHAQRLSHANYFLQSLQRSSRPFC